ncbi:hypothetical protein QFC22_003668 [Naganishia vaughanmartiniae]|uniref:Uncharacterized protein n=1 Tax=Naganishia vaughanmartiniae TaxID=1424756 RepID=A0ACC2X6X0_9TREE|nr:hypothetical protein QFC22_003668 [Naganishia vaughanmartiniae]
MDPFEDDDLDDLKETKEERLAYDMETTAELLESWSKKSKWACQSPPQRIEHVGTQTSAVASTSSVTSKQQGQAMVSTVLEAARGMGPPAMVLPAASKFDITTNIASSAKGKTDYLRSLDRIVTKSSISRSTSDLGPSTNSSELPSFKGKGKEKPLPMMSTPPLTEEPMTLDAPAPTKLSPATGKPKLVKIPLGLQNIIDNWTNFEQTTKAKQTGKKPKLKKGKGMVSVDKWDLQRVSNVFQESVIAVVHHLGAKGEQLIPRWAHVHRHGGKTCVRYTPEVTHIACDHDVALSSICQFLGIEDLSEIREGTLILDWKWFVSCPTAGTLIPVSDTLLHPCMRPQAAIQRRASAPSGSNLTLGKRKSTSDVLASVTAGKKKPRNYAPTDSDTSQDPDRTASLTNEGTLTTADRWLPPAAGEQADGLDMMISGLKTGAVMETEADIDEEDVMLEETGVGAINGTRNNSTNSDGPYKCQNANPGIKRASINEDIALGLESLGAVYEKAQHKNMFQKRAYKQAANIVRNCPFRIQDEEAALKLKGIGVNIAQRIGEIIRNGGRSDREYFEDNEESRTVAMFGKIYGVGQKAQELWDRGARSLDDLRTGQWGLTGGQKIGLSLYDDLNDRMPREEAKSLFEMIRKEGDTLLLRITTAQDYSLTVISCNTATVVHICGNGEKEIVGLHVEAMGSYRRGEATCGDLDILISRDPRGGKDCKGVFGELIKRLVEKKIVTHTLSAPGNYDADDAKWMGIGRLPQRHDPKKDISKKGDLPKSKFRRIGTSPVNLREKRPY